MEWSGKWIKPSQEMGEVCPVFIREFDGGENGGKEIAKAELWVTALGVYEAVLNGSRVGQYVLAPGWTSYKSRLQYQVYDITQLLKDENRLSVTVGKGWYRSPVPGWITEEGKAEKAAIPAGLLAEIVITDKEGNTTCIGTDESWKAGESKIRFSEIYDGETFDAGFKAAEYLPAEVFEWTKDNLIPQEGEEITEQEYIKAAAVFTAPNGETVVDFGQEVTGYVQFTLDARAGDKVEISHGEVLDKDGNFYNANYRAAKAKIFYTCCDGVQTYKHKMTFFGFRYIRLDQFHHLRRTVHPVRYQQDFQTVLCHLAGAFPAKKMFHIHPVPFLCFPKNTSYFCPKRYSFFEIQERNFFSQHTIHHIAVSLTRRCIASD